MYGLWLLFHVINEWDRTFFFLNINESKLRVHESEKQSELK